MRNKKRNRPLAQSQHTAPPAHHNRADRAIRQRWCAEAARIMADEGVTDYLQAKRKAANRLSLPTTAALPTNKEVEAALAEHLQLFHGVRTGTTLRRLRQLALEAMRFLQDFNPMLTGPVLGGNVTPSSEIQLHVTADYSEQVGLFLQERGVPYVESERCLRFGGSRHETLPTYRFFADGTPIELCVFSKIQAREAPLSPVDSRPVPRANIKMALQLVEEG